MKFLKVFSFILSFLMLTPTASSNNNGEIFYQRCERDSLGKLRCTTVQGIPFMRYKRVFLKDLRVGRCYRRNTQSNKIVFYKILKIKNRTIFAMAQAVPQSNIKNFDDKIFLDNYPWNGQNFNQEIEEFPCSETPTLSDMTYLTKNCRYRPGETKRRTLYCEDVLRVNTYERSF